MQNVVRRLWWSWSTHCELWRRERSTWRMSAPGWRTGEAIAASCSTVTALTLAIWHMYLFIFIATILLEFCCGMFITLAIWKTNIFRLAKIHEKDGKVEEAAKIMQELQVSPLYIRCIPSRILLWFDILQVKCQIFDQTHDAQVETYGSMERQEKVELILEQMRLCLLTQDYIRSVLGVM